MNINKPIHTRRRFWLGLIINIIMLVAMFYVIDSGLFPHTAVIAFLFIIAAAVISGLLAGLISAAFYSAFVILIIPDDPARVAVLITTAFITGGVIGYIQDRHWKNAPKVRFVDSLNGNLVMLHVIIKELDRLIVLMPSASRESLAEFAGDIRAAAADLTTNTQGWVAIARARGWIEKRSND